MQIQKIKAVIDNKRTEVTVKYDQDKLIMTFSEAENFKKSIKVKIFISA